MRSLVSDEWEEGVLALLRVVAAFLFMQHGNWLFPFLNRGEPAVLFCFVFLYFAARGAGRFSLDWLLFGRKAEQAARM